ncbi:MAG: alpha/beta hydrolase [Mycobacterium sp.]
MTSSPQIGTLGEDVLIPTRDGRRLRAMVAGPDSDTLVILEAGLGVSGLYWLPVHRLLSQRFRVVAYDRAGLGGSDPTDLPRTLSNLADDLVTVIEAFPHRQVILVGHSWGGPIVRVAAARRLAAGCGDIAGLVLADQSDENDVLFYQAGARLNFAVVAAVMSVLALFARVVPLPRLVLRRRSPLRQAMVEAIATQKSLQAFAAEMRVAIAELEWLRDQPAELGAVPIRVLSGQLTRRFDKKNRANLLRGHRITVENYAGAVYVPAQASGHMIPLTEPELIADQVSELAG